MPFDNKEVEDPVPVPRQFRPVPAVPDDTQDIERQPKKVLQLNGVDNIENNVTNTKNVSLPRNCLGKCLDQFCLLVSDLTLYNNCEDKCKTFCQ